MKALGIVSSSLYRAASFADAWMGLPAKVSESLHFRQEWRNFLAPETARTKQSTLWIHGASVGEIEDLGAYFLDSELVEASGFARERIVLTASSVSARERLEGWSNQGFAYAGPLPPESTREINAFLHLLKPAMLIMSHADIWPVALDEARKKLSRGCLWLPSRPPNSKLLVDGYLSGFVRAIGCRSQEDLEHFTRDPLAGSPKLEWVGNPRVDRILKRIRDASKKEEHTLERSGCAPKAERATLLVGSCWLEDAQVLSAAWASLSDEEAQLLDVVAIPHETRDAHLVAAIKSALPRARVLAVQGILTEAYKDFGAALVGGGFRTGLHNVLEPALWEVPTFVGPLTRKQPETGMLERLGQLRIIHKNEDLVHGLRDLIDPIKRAQLKQAAIAAANELRRHEGSTQRLVALLKETQ